jgi:hypothetical protein
MNAEEIDDEVVSDRGESTAPDDPKGPSEILSLEPRYIQKLPAWIYAHKGYRKLNAGERRALDVIGWKSDDPKTHPAAKGNLIGCFCGDDLAELIGCGRRTLSTYIAKFEKLRFIVTLTRGGLSARGKLASVVGIPAAPGSLDSIAAPKRRNPEKYVREWIHARLASSPSAPSLPSDADALVGRNGADLAPIQQQPRAVTAQTSRRNGEVPSPDSIPLYHPPLPSSSCQADDDGGGDLGDQNSTRAKGDEETERSLAQVWREIDEADRRTEPDPLLRQVLHAIGVRGHNLERLSKRTDIDHLTPLRLIASKQASGVENLAGFLVSRLDAYGGDYEEDFDDDSKSLIDDDDEAQRRLMIAKILVIRDGRFMTDIECLRGLDLSTLPEIDAEVSKLQAFKIAIRTVLRLSCGDDGGPCSIPSMANYWSGDRTARRRLDDACQMTAVYGRNPDYYVPLLSVLPAWRVVPDLEKAIKSGVADPVAHVLEKIKESLAPEPEPLEAKSVDYDEPIPV